MAVRRNPGQRGYDCRGMTGDEVLAFKLFDRAKGDEGALRSCLHTAFEDPPPPPPLRFACRG